MKRLLLLVVAIIVSVAAISCTKLENSADVNIACTSSDGCPEGFICKLNCGESSGICISKDVQESPPNISDTSLSASIASISSNIVATFTVDKPLRAAPNVAIEGIDGAMFAMVSGDISKPDQEYKFVYTPRGFEPEEPHSIIVKVVDTNCNSSESTIGTITFDFSNPIISNVESKDFYISTQNEVKISFTVSDAHISQPPTVEALKISCLSRSCDITTLATLQMDESSSWPNFSFHYKPTGNEEQGLCREVSIQSKIFQNTAETKSRIDNIDIPDGTWYSIRILATDEAGNLTEYVSNKNLWCFDFEKPQIEDMEATPIYLRSGDNLTISFKASEVLLEDPQVSCINLDNPRKSLNLLGGNIMANLYVYAKEVPENSDGIYKIVVSNIADLAGNRVLLHTGTDNHGNEIHITVDSQPPNLIGDPQISGGNNGFFKENDTILLRFSTNEQVKAQVVLDMGSKVYEFSKKTEQHLQDAYLYEYELNLSGSEQEGSGFVKIYMADDAGNQSFWANDTASVLDFTSPQVVEGSGFVIYRKPAECKLLTNVSAITHGASATVSFMVSEELMEDPVVYAMLDENHRIECQKVSNNANSFVYICASENLTDGTYTLMAQLEDFAGHNETVPVDGISIVVDTTPPPRIDTSATNANGEPLIGLLRSPWGDLQDVDSHFSISGKPNSIDTNQINGVIAFDVSSQSSDIIFLGGAPVNEDGSFQISLIPSDRVRVFLMPIDEACNLGEASLLEYGIWRASFGKKLAGETDINPHSIKITKNFEPTMLTQRFTDELSNQQYQDIFHQQDAVLESSAAVWEEMPTSRTSIDGRASATGIYDPRTGNVLFVGGYKFESTFEFFQDVWKWDGNSLSYQQTSGTFPAYGYGESVVYFPPSGEILWMFGSDGATVQTNDIYSLYENRWSKKYLQNVPQKRIFANVAYDEEHKVIVVFGGINQGTNQYYNDLWQWDGSEWTQLQPNENTSCTSNQRPCGRSNAVFQYDPTNNGILLFGGFNNSQIQMNDTWLWDGEQWSKLNPEHIPHARISAGSATLPDGRIALIGGYYMQGAYDYHMLNDFWIWNGSDWEQQEDPPFSPRSNMAVVYDKSRNRLIVAFGVRNSTYLNDIWEWDGDQWHEVPFNSLNPPNLMLSSAAYNHNDKKIYVGYGANPLNFMPTNEIWSFDGYKWEETNQPTTKPDPRIGASFAFDEDDNYLIVSGGSSTPQCQSQMSGFADTWRFRLNDTWTSFTSQASCYHVGMYIPALGEVAKVGFAETTNGGVQTKYIKMYVWQGSFWQELVSRQVNAPEEKISAAYNEAADAIIIPEQSLAIYNVSQIPYTRQIQLPTNLYSSAAAYSPDLARVVIYGGLDGSSNYITDIYLWDGDSIRTIPAIGKSPNGIHSHIMVYNENLHEFVVALGIDSANKRTLWKLRIPPERKPAAIVKIDAGVSFVSSDWIKYAKITAKAGATAFTTDTNKEDDSDIVGEPIYGAMLYVWNWYKGSFQEIDGCSNSAPKDAPAELTCTIRADELQNIQSNSANEIYIAIAPKSGAGNGPEEAEVSIEGFEFELGYRIQIDN